MLIVEYMQILEYVANKIIIILSWQCVINSTHHISDYTVAVKDMVVHVTVQKYIFIYIWHCLNVFISMFEFFISMFDWSSSPCFNNRIKYYGIDTVQCLKKVMMSSLLNFYNTITLSNYCVYQTIHDCMYSFVFFWRIYSYIH